MTPPSSATILLDLYTEVKGKPLFLDKYRLLQERLRIGWGTLRVAIGMAFTNHVYEWCKYLQSEALAREEEE